MCKNCIKTPTRTINFPDPFSPGLQFEVIPPLSADLQWMLGTEEARRVQEEIVQYILQSLAIPREKLESPDATYIIPKGRYDESQ